MLQRPLCISALFLCALFAISYVLHWPLLPGIFGREAEKALQPYLTSDEPVVLEGTVSHMRLKDFEYEILLRDASFASDPDEKLPVITGVRFYVKASGKETDSSFVLPKAGDRILVRGTLRTVSEARNPGQFDPAEYARLSGIFFELKNEPAVIRNFGNEFKKGSNLFLRIHSVLKNGAVSAQERICGRICRIFPENAAGVLCAVLVGDRSYLSDRQKSLWQMSGISHILAISGLHLTLIGMTLFRLLGRMQIPVRIRGGLCAGLLTGYTVLIGAPVSAVRALVMFWYLIGARVSFRHSDRWNAIALSAILLLAGNPWYLFSSGFQMSFCAVIIFACLKGRGTLFSAAAVYLVMLPLQIWYFAKLPVLGLPLNLTLVPLLPVLLIAGLTGLVFGGIAAYPASSLVRGAEELLRILRQSALLTRTAGHPAAWKLFLYAAALLLLFVLYRKLRHKKRRILLLPLAAVSCGIFFLPQFTGLSMTLLDVGQGESMLCRVRESPFSEELNFLIDGGSISVDQVGSRRILPFLQYEGIRRIDYLFLTHADQDHVNGILELLQMVSDGEDPLVIDTLVLPDIAGSDDDFQQIERLAEDLGIRIVSLHEGGRIQSGAAVVRVLGPPDTNGPAGRMQVIQEGNADSADRNAQSLVLLLSYRDFDALLTGDVTSYGEDNLYQILGGNRNGLAKERKIEVLKVAHHGSKNSTGEDFLYLLKPQTALISCGARNRYGHPHEELLERLRQVGAEIYRTDESGAITIESDGFTYSVRGFCADSAKI